MTSLALGWNFLRIAQDERYGNWEADKGLTKPKAPSGLWLQLLQGQSNLVPSDLWTSAALHSPICSLTIYSSLIGVSYITHPQSGEELLTSRTRAQPTPILRTCAVNVW